MEILYSSGRHSVSSQALTARSVLLGWVASGLVACSSGTDSAAKEIADTIFLSGSILTMEEAVAVRDGLIVYAGERRTGMFMKVERDWKGTDET